MKVIFTNDSLGKLRYVALSNDKGTGFVKTERIGKYIFITDIICGDLNKGIFSKNLINIYDLWKTNFGGIFVIGGIKLIPDILNEKLLININNNEYEISILGSEEMKDRIIKKGTFH